MKLEGRERDFSQWKEEPNFELILLKLSINGESLVIFWWINLDSGEQEDKSLVWHVKKVFSGMKGKKREADNSFLWKKKTWEAEIKGSNLGFSLSDYSSLIIKELYWRKKCLAYTKKTRILIHSFKSLSIQGLKQSPFSCENEKDNEWPWMKRDHHRDFE